jgi:high-affinity iron transporter
MDFSLMLPTFVITFREGVEAALVVGIVLACLQKAHASYLNRWVYGGIAVGLALSGMLGVTINWGIQALNSAYPQYTAVIEPLLEGGFSLIAIVMLSWMLLWMTKQSQLMKAQVEGFVSQALQQNSQAGWGVFSLVLLAILREGFESVLFVIAKFQQGLAASLGTLLGIAAATAVGALLFKWGVRINIKQFFQVMGVLLLLIISGLVVSSLGHFDAMMQVLSQTNRASSGLCFFYEKFTKYHSCVLGARVWDTSKILPEDQFPGIFLSAMFGYTQNLYLVQAIAYLTFLVTVGSAYFRSLAPNRVKVANSRTTTTEGIKVKL